MTKNKLTPSLCLALVLASPMAGAEAQYPAANFEPTIIFQDADLIVKHTQAAKERALTKPQPTPIAKQQQVISPPAVAEQTNVDFGISPEKAQSKQEDSIMENFPIVLIILALAGFVFWSAKRSGSKAATPASPSPASIATGTTGETGVAKYLKAAEEAARKAAGTGVDKYLKSLAGSVQSKVSAPAQAQVPSAPETGVARYLRSK